MVVYNFDKVICVKFLLAAGFAESNTSLNTIFNQHRSTFYSSFCNEFNALTESLPNDLMLPTKVYIPLPGSHIDRCRFDIQVPKTSFFLKKLNLVLPYYDTSFYSLNLDILELFKLSVLKAINFDRIFLSNLQYFFLTFVGSVCSFNGLLGKNLLFVLFRLTNINGVHFYNIKFNIDFKHIYFIN